MSRISVSRDNGIATVTLVNPPANVLTIELINEINQFLDSLVEDGETRVVVFKSANELFFICHLDLNLINGTPEGHYGCLEFSRMVDSLKKLRQLTIAVVDGVARGGGNEFVMACDLAFGTENAAFAQPELGVNIPTGGQGAVQFARRMGRGKALKALLTGVDFTAQQAERLNIITEFVPRADMEPYLTAFLTAIAGLELRDFAMYKEIIAASLIDENRGVEVELRHFLARAKEDKSQAIFSAFLKHGGQTEREATDFQGLFADTARELGVQV